MRLVKEISYQDAQMRMLTNEREDLFVDINIEKLSEVLGYNSKNGVEVIMNRNEYLKTREFSRVEKIITNGGIQEARVFTEDGIMEVAFLASTEKAREFRAFMRHTVKKLRANQNHLVGIENRNLLAIQENYKIMADGYEELRDTSKEVLKILNNQSDEDVIKALDTIEKELIKAGKKLDKIDVIEIKLEKLEKRVGEIEKKFNSLGNLFGKI